MVEIGSENGCRMLVQTAGINQLLCPGQVQAEEVGL